MKRAKLRQAATLEDIDFRHPRGLDRILFARLMTGRWVADHQNVLLCGPTGVGKTFLACALANQACRQGHSALYVRLPRLLADLAGAVRCALKPNQWAYDAGQLTVIGKRNKERIVPVSPRTLDALRAHWIDRGMDFDVTDDPRPLLGPLVIPAHEAALERHAAPNAAGYTGDALYRLFQATLKRLRLDPNAPEGFSSEQFNELATASPHALRHTWGTLAVEDGMPLDVAQAILGHRSPSTTAIYVQAKTKRILEEGAKYFAKRREKAPTS